ncbi:amidohydrolase [Pedobacter cryoconitis]|uniref:Amidohydrolase 3 domain-containing protein n=1 Tax=Pedobacter cryoconitis TaxID=188932 RepID=A0A327SR90_9SPHI|nr:amidohydrolase [Pedobacter cryoconitis]RAJ31022.1 hypothetical protein LY11_02251 [Pedobacter cryoconitis]
MKKGLLILFIVTIYLFFSCNNSFKRPVDKSTADTIYYGGNIITMEGDFVNYVEAIAVKDGKIIFAGTKSDANKLNGTHTKMNDLEGKTLLPGFVDGHSHFSEVGLQSVSANLLSPPDGPVKNIDELQKVLREFMAVSPIVKAHQIVLVMNYDNSQLKEQRSPIRQELDAVSTQLPIIVIHQSGHLAVLNSKALAMVGITADSKNPDGGIIEREADGKTPNGVLQENAFFQIIPKLPLKFTPEEVASMIQTSEAIYIKNGFTTIQDGKTTPVNIKVLPELAKKGAFKVDIVSYPDLVLLSKDSILRGPLMSKKYTNHFRIGGVKITMDGSPQGKTAWFTQPYYKVPAGQDSTYAGYPAFTDEKLIKWFELAYKNNWQLLTHTNGDAAIDQLIRMDKAAAIKYPAKDRRTVMIHGQFLRHDQVKEIMDADIFASLFPLHTFNWGDFHRQSVVGPERAENMSPTGWLLENKMKFSIHSDAPVIFPNSMQLISTAVNRTTRTNYLLGPKQKISPYVALQAMTIWPAYQHFEEDVKGSLVKGKNADFVILDQNPIKADPKKINEIKVMETIKEGKTVYKN